MNLCRVKFVVSSRISVIWNLWFLAACFTRARWKKSNHCLWGCWPWQG